VARSRLQACWVYPHFDHRFVSQTVIEKVATGEYSEDVPYDPDWDKYALVFDAEPGQLLTWPQHSPHRVSNLEGLNVSLSTEHKNPRAIRRINVHQENQFLRHKLGLGCMSSSVDGVTAHVKQAVARAVRAYDKIRGDQSEQFEYPISFKIDPEAPLGYVDLDLSADEITSPPCSRRIGAGQRITKHLPNVSTRTGESEFRSPVFVRKPGFLTHFVASGGKSLAGKADEQFDRKRIVHTLRINLRSLTLPAMDLATAQ